MKKSEINKNSLPEFSVCAIFKNEALNLSEWLDHYFFRGADKIYLINDGSTDNYSSILHNHERSIDIELYQNDIPKISNRQMISYNKFFLPVKKRSDWTLICDLDEFIYSPHCLNLKSVLKNEKSHDCVFSNWVMFSSCGNDKHPPSIVNSCVKRMEYGQEIEVLIKGEKQRFKTDGTKYFIKNSCAAENLWVHHPLGDYNGINLSYGGGLDALLINHYATQSRQFWEESKMTRGDVNCHHPDDARNWNYFEALDCGDIIDTRLKDQNLF
jgi:hypothetical protein